MIKELNQIPEDSFRIFLRVLRNFINSEEEEIPVTEELFGDLCYLAKIHSVFPILYYVIRSRAKELEASYPGQMEWLKKSYMLAVVQSIRQDAGKEEMREAFRRQGLPLLFFKGAQIRSFYPVPELRTMGDLDCLIASEDRMKAHALMLDLGYECQSDKGDVWVYRKGTVVVEMHDRIAANSILNEFDYASFFSDALNHGTQENQEFCFSKEYHFCFLIYHIAKHLSSTGAGVRMFMDIVVFLRHYGDTFDKREADRLLRAASLKKTAEAVYGLCDRWFGTKWSGEEKIPESVLDELEAYIVAGGTFGFETHNIGHVYKRKAYVSDECGKESGYGVRLIGRYLFPPADYMRLFLPAVERHKWLLPAAWIKRWWTGVFLRRDRSLATIRSMAENDGERSYREYRMLKNIGL